MGADHDSRPRRVGNTAELTATPADGGVAWKLEMADRGLDSNVIRLGPAGSIDTHTGAEVDVLIHVLAGSGTVGVADGEFPVAPGDLVWLPRRTQRSFHAGADGLSYLTVHSHREPTLTIGHRPS